MSRAKMPVPVLLALVALPALLVGATLWVVGDLVPVCEIKERQRLTSPNEQFDLVVFSRFCGDTDLNTQAALVPPGEEVPFDAASFFSTDVDAVLQPAWLAAGAIEITRPDNAEILRADETVAGVSVTYR